MMIVKNSDGAEVSLVVGAWYVGVNFNGPLESGAPDFGEIAQYVGEGQFYDEGAEEETDMRNYEYIQFSHMGRL